VPCSNQLEFGFSFLQHLVRSAARKSSSKTVRFGRWGSCLLAFREAPAILAACEELRADPDLFLFDGYGLAHPRRMGLACHLGLCLDKPAIGCAKSRLCGEHDEPPPDAGAWAPLRDGVEVIGAAVRTRQGGSPVYVSIGHKVDLETAIRWVLATCRPVGAGLRGYRLPEPCRLAHRESVSTATVSSQARSYTPRR
jgi:deoxyribonuclease V